MDVGGYKMSENQVPSEEEFARAKAAMRNRDRGLAQVRETLLKGWAKDGICQVFILYSEKTKGFGSFVFFETEKQATAALRDGLGSKLKEKIVEELEKAGRGTKDSLLVSVEIDSDENVQKNFEGDYYSRLR